MATAASRPESRHEMLQVGPLEILPDERLARVDGRALMLSIRELRLLTELARRRDRIMSREELFSLVWGRELRPGDRSVDVYVRKLRVKLEHVLPGVAVHPHALRLWLSTVRRASTKRQRSVHNWITPHPIVAPRLGATPN